MSYFSDMLDSCIFESGMPLHELAALSGINRTYISKIRNGSRIMRDEAKMMKLIRSLRCPPELEQRLLREYRIEVFGREKYETVQAVKELIQSMAYVPGVPFHDMQLDMPQIKNIIHGQNEVNYVMNLILYKEASRQGGHLRIVAQHGLDALALHLPATCSKAHSLTVDHITCLRSSNVYGASLNNLQCLKAFMPVLMSGCNYNLLYYYGDSSHINNMNLMPYAIVSSECVMTISYYGDMALVLDDPAAVAAYTHMIDSLKASCRPMVDTLTVEGRFQQYEQAVISNLGKGATLLALCNTPALTPFLTEDIIQRRLRTEGLEETLATGLFEMWEGVNAMQCVKFFSLEGLQSFINTGRISGIPENFYDPLDREERLSLLKKWYDHCLENDNYAAIAVQPNAFAIPDNVIIEASDVENILLSYTHPLNTTSFHIVLENSISTSIYEFLKYLQNGNMVFSEEDSLGMAKQAIRALELELS